MGSLLNDPGPLRFQRQHTVEALSQVMAAHVGLNAPGNSNEDSPYNDAPISLPPDKPEEAKPADIERALKAEEKAQKKTKAKPPAPPKPKAIKGPPPRKTVRVQFI